MLYQLNPEQAMYIWKRGGMVVRYSDHYPRWVPYTGEDYIAHRDGMIMKPEYKKYCSRANFPR